MSTNYDFTRQTFWGACLLGRCAERKLSGKLQEATAPEQKKSLAIEDVWTFACSPIAGTNVCKRPAREKQGYSVARSPTRACCSAAGSERVQRVDMTGAALEGHTAMPLPQGHPTKTALQPRTYPRNGFCQGARDPFQLSTGTLTDAAYCSICTCYTDPAKPTICEPSTCERHTSKREGLQLAKEQAVTSRRPYHPDACTARLVFKASWRRVCSDLTRRCRL